MSNPKYTSPKTEFNFLDHLPDYKLERSVNFRHGIIHHIINEKQQKRLKVKQISLNKYLPEYKPFFIDNFNEEIQMMIDTSHNDNFVDIHKVFWDDMCTQVYICMEDIPQTLKQLITVSKLSQTQVLSILKQMASGLQYMHKSLFVKHLDLNSSNVLLQTNLNGQDKVKLGEFSESIILNSFTKQARVCLGQDPYQAPELFSQKSKITPKVDIYSLGVIAYEMCTGQMPFQDDDWVQPYTKIRKQEIQSFGDTCGQYSKEFQEFVFAMLSFTPDDRPDINQVIEQIKCLETTNLKEGASKSINQESGAFGESLEPLQSQFILTPTSVEKTSSEEKSEPQIPQCRVIREIPRRIQQQVKFVEQMNIIDNEY